MKVALCISGHARNYEDNILEYGSIKTQLNADVFIHSYHNRGTNTRFSFNEEWDNEFLKEDDLSKINEILNPVKQVYTEDIDTKGKLKGVYYQTQKMFLPEAHYKMIYKMWQCNELKKDYEKDNNWKYDLVIRTRFDVLPKKLDLSKFEPGKLFCGRHNQMRDLMGDVFFIGDSQVVDTMCNLKEAYGESLNPNDYRNMEHVFTSWTEQNNIPLIMDGSIVVHLRDKIFN